MASTTPEPTAVPILVVETGGVRRRLGPQRAIPLSANGAAALAVSRQVVGGGVCVLAGWSVAESTGAAAASFDLYDGSGIGGGLLGVERLAAGDADTVIFESPGILVETGKLYLSVLAGSLTGVILVRMENGQS